MSFRGRGRGRGGYNYGRFAKEEKYEVFPEITQLSDINLEQIEEQFTTLVKWNDDLQKFWASSAYHIDDPKDSKNNERSVRKQPLSDYIKMTSAYVPAELAGKNVRQSKKTKWDLQLDLERLDIFEKLDKKTQGKEEEKKEEEEEDEDIENLEDEEDDSDDDYAQGGDFDDDEDENNMNDDHDDDEGCY